MNETISSSNEIERIVDRYKDDLNTETNISDIINAREIQTICIYNSDSGIVSESRINYEKYKEQEFYRKANGKMGGN